MYDELLDGTSGSDEGGSLKISGKSGRIQTLNNVISNNGTKNNACLVADLFGDWREEIVAGTAQRAVLSLRNSGDLNAKDLKAVDVDASVNGSGALQFSLYGLSLYPHKIQITGTGQVDCYIPSYIGAFHFQVS